MGASSVTGSGPGAAFPGNKTAANLALINERVRIQLSQPWELVFSRFVSNTDPNDTTPIPAASFDYGEPYEFLAGVAQNAANVPITQPVLQGVGPITVGLSIGGMSPTYSGLILFSPDGGTTVIPIININGSTAISHGTPNNFRNFAIVPPMALVCVVNNSGFFVNSTGVTSANIVSYFGDTGNSCYMVFLRRRVY